MNNTILVEYQGGGYSGCFWEWNYFAISNGVFHNIKTTGRAGVKTYEEALEVVRDPQSYIYALNNQKHIDDFTDNSNAGNVVGTLKKLVKLDLDDFKVRCQRCGKYHEPDAYQLDYNAYRGDGGIGISYEEFHCENCNSEHSCSECGEYMSVYEEEHSGHFRECENCKPDPVQGEDYTEEEWETIHILEKEIAWLGKAWLTFPVAFNREVQLKQKNEMLCEYVELIAYLHDGRYAEEMKTSLEYRLAA